MMILVTGPSCSGKTSFARHWTGLPCFHLDNMGDERREIAAAIRGRGQSAIFEGMLTGNRPDIGAFLALMDCMIVLAAPLRVRLRRTILRDGCASLARFMWNEYHWRTHNRPILFDPAYAAVRCTAIWQPHEA